MLSISRRAQLRVARATKRVAPFLAFTKRRGVVVGLVVLVFCAKSLLLTQALKLSLRQVPGLIVRLDRARLTLLPGSMTVWNATVETPERPRATLFDLQEVTVHWRWRDLLAGRLTASLSGHGGTFTLARLPASRRQGKPTPHLTPEVPEAETILKRWPDIRRRMIPFRIESIHLVDLSLTYLDLAVEPTLTLPVARISLTGEGLTNRPNFGEQKRPGHVRIWGQVGEKGEMSMDVRVALSQTAPDLHIVLDAYEIALSGLNPALSRYAGISFDAGMLSLALTADAKGGRFRGCVRPTIARLQLREAQEKKTEHSWAVRAATKVADAATRLLFRPEDPPRSVQLKFSGTLPEGVTEEQGVLRLLAAALDAIRNEALTLKLTR